MRTQQSPLEPRPMICAPLWFHYGSLPRQQQQGEAATTHFTRAASLALPNNWPQSHKQRFRVLLQSERFQLAQLLQDIELARDLLKEWIKYEPENRQLQKMYKELTAP